jgi:hypothetical protein
MYPAYHLLSIGLQAANPRLVKEMHFLLYK